MEWRPVANISETANDYVIKAELPEVPKKDIDVSVHDDAKIQAECNDGVLTVRIPKAEARKPRPIEVQVR